MTKHRPHSVTPSIFTTNVLIGTLLAATGLANAEDVAITNPSFEFPDAAADQNPANYILDPNPNGPFGWSPWFEDQEVNSNYGALRVLTAPLPANYDPLYNTPAPDGDQVLLLFNFNSAIGDGAYGVEQELDENARADYDYYLAFQVGNIQTGGNVGSQLNFDGFPDYRVQLLAGDLLIAEAVSPVHLNMDERDGEFGTLILQASVLEGSAFVGQPLKIRFINENNSLGPFNDLVANSEVNFDNVVLKQGPSVEPSTTQIYADDLSIYPIEEPEGAIDWGFTLSGKGTKRVLVVGAGQSLQTGIEPLAKDPFLTLSRDGRMIARNDNWSDGSDAKEIREIAAKNNLPLAAGDAAILLDLSPGDYNAALTVPGESGVYTAMRIYDLEPQSKAKLRFGNSAQDLRSLWIGKAAKK